MIDRTAIRNAVCGTFAATLDTIAEMIYLSLDTCVWLDLLNVDQYSPDNLFDELRYHMGNGHVTCITTRNINREWNRHKATKERNVMVDYSKIDGHIAAHLDPESPAMNRPEMFSERVSARILQIDYLLDSQAELADETDGIYIKAAHMNLNVQPPNHVKESLRDTVNILSLAEHMKSSGHSKCHFVTINYNDFSAGKDRKRELVEGLTEMFRLANLHYLYIENTSTSKAWPLKNIFRENSLPSFNDHLMEQRRQREASVLAARKEGPATLQPFDDSEFLDNIQYLDLILKRAAPSATDKAVLDMLFRRHEGYHKYFMQKIDPDGLV